MSTSLLEGMGLSFPSTPTDFDVGTDFTSSLAGVTNPIPPYRYTPISFGGQSLSGDPVVVRGLQDYISSGDLAPEDLAILISGLVAIGALASTMGGGQPKVEVTAKGTNSPADPAPAPAPDPAPVIPVPVTPSVDPADPAKEVPKQNPEDTATPAEKEIAKILGIPLADVLKYGLPLLSSFLSYKSAQDAREEARGASFGASGASGPVTATRRAYEGSTYKPAAQGGIMSLAGGGEVLDSTIKSFIDQVLTNGKTQQEQAAEINEAAQKFGVGRDRLAQVTGYDLQTVNNFLGPNIVGRKTINTPYQIYDKSTDTYRYVDAEGYNRWQQGLPLTMTTVPGSPIYYGGAPSQQGDYNFGGSSFTSDLAPPPLRTLSEEDSYDILNPSPELKGSVLRQLQDFNEEYLAYNEDGNVDPYKTIENLKQFDPALARHLSAYAGNLVPLVQNLQQFRPDIFKSGYFTSEGFISPEDFATIVGDYRAPDFLRLLQSMYNPDDSGGGYAAGGVASLKHKQPFYLGGSTDGMADEVPAHIDGKRPAALSDGEFVIPADVVSHLGNGNSNAGAQRLYKMMDDIREARTGNRKQGIQINPNNFMPR
ncbi:hypothetical protein EB118_15280 [bacterium]|nr:hypothetical protein [bacterium]